jgi:hypothetical protein
MTFAYPESLNIDSEGVDDVFLTSGTTMVGVDYAHTSGVAPDDKWMMQAVLSAAADSYKDSSRWKNFRVVDSGGVWDAGVGRAYYCEILVYLTQIGADDIPVAQRFVMLLSDDGQKQVLLSYGRTGASQLTDRERSILKAVVATVRVR